MNKQNPKKSVFIVIPTYNEAENIEPLIGELAKVSRELKNWHVDILVVDDNSPDGTAEIVKKLQHKFATVHLRAQRTATQNSLDATPIQGHPSAQRPMTQNSNDAPSAQRPQTQLPADATPGNNTIHRTGTPPNTISAPRLHLLVNHSKKGLGAAYTKAFTHILQNHDPDFIIQMDADFQHNPKDIPRFLSKASRGYKFIIGSRYIAGGDYPNWSFKRKLYSWGANLIARFIAGIYNIDDCTSGFRCISAGFLRSFDLKTLKSDGYAFQMSLLHAASKKRIPIIQIPILFPNRRSGRSKLGHKDIREFFVNALKLRFKRYNWLDK